MTSIQEKRATLLQAKLKEMADYGVAAQTEEISSAFEPIVELAEEAQPAYEEAYEEKAIGTFSEYEKLYLTPRPSRPKSGFTINAGLLQLLRQVLIDIKAVFL